MTAKSKCDRLAFGSMFTVSKSLQVEDDDEEKQGCCWLWCSHAGLSAAGCHPSLGTLVFLATTTKHCRLEPKEQLLFSDSFGGRLEGSP